MISTLLLAACVSRGALPDTRCTPGAVRRVSVQEVCRRGSSKAARSVSAVTKKAVYSAYGLSVRPGVCCEVDHLISLELGGSNDQKNLWPELYEPRPGAHEKDVLENHLHSEVCAGRLSLAKAQGLIVNDWVAAYRSLTSAQRVTAAGRR